MRNRKDEARAEKLKQRLDAGFVSRLFPEVVSIVIMMRYTQRGMKSLLRTVNFFPDSYAFFRIDCLMEDCVDGGFDLTQVITSMIRSHREAAKGDIICESADHSAIFYEIAIQYV